jgi:glycosyltransferase involved in cell wall biosynthesis
MLQARYGEVMRIMVIPTTDWTRHPVPNRLNFIFERLAEKHDIFICHFNLKKFNKYRENKTQCVLEEMGGFSAKDPSLYYILNAIPHTKDINGIISRNDIEIIVSANILPSFIATIVNGNVPIVYDYLDHFEESAAIYYPDSLVGVLAKKVVAKIVAKNLKHAELVTTVTTEFEEYLKSKGIKNIKVVPNGVDTKVVRPIASNNAKKRLKLEGDTVIGYLGSLEHWIDLETVISALPELSKKVPDIKLLIVGPSLFTDYGTKLNELAKQLKVSERIIFTGGVPHNEAYKYISAMDICLNPRKPLSMNKMTIGGKVFNYLACGKPVMSSNMEPLEKLFSNEDGMYFYSTKNDLIQLIPKILEQKHDRIHYRNVAKQYDWNIISTKYEQVLKSLP